MISLKTKIGLGVLAVFIAGNIFVLLNSSTTDSYKATTIPSGSQASTTVIPVTTKPSTPTTKPVTTVKNYSMSDVATHNNAKSCWTAIGGNVYNLTSWIDQHPGGRQAILSLCGVDGTSAFEGQHGGQRRPEAELKSLLIGPLS